MAKKKLLVQEHFLEHSTRFGKDRTISIEDAIRIFNHTDTYRDANGSREQLLGQSEYIKPLNHLSSGHIVYTFFSTFSLAPA